MKKVKGFALASDIIVFVRQKGKLSLLLIKRKNSPYKNMWALPGGFVEIHESFEDAAKRELQEETGIKNVTLKELGIFGNPQRDPRGRVISVAYVASLSQSNMKAKAHSDAADLNFFPMKNLPSLAFDRAQIVKKAVQSLKQKKFP